MLLASFDMYFENLYEIFNTAAERVVDYWQQILGLLYQVALFNVMALFLPFFYFFIYCLIDCFCLGFFGFLRQFLCIFLAILELTL